MILLDKNNFRKSIKKAASLLLALLFLFTGFADSIKLSETHHSANCLSPSSSLKKIIYQDLFFKEIAEKLKKSESEEDISAAKQIFAALAENLRRSGFQLKQKYTASNHYFYITSSTKKESFHDLTIKVETNQDTINLVIQNPDDGYWYYLDDRVIKEAITLPLNNLKLFHNYSTQASETNQLQVTKTEQRNKNTRLIKTLKFIISLTATAALIAAAAYFSPGVLLSSLVILSISLISSTVSLTEAALMSLAEDEDSLNILAQKARTDKKALKALTLIKKLENKVPTITLTNNAVNIPGGIAIARISSAFMSNIASSILSTIAIMIIGENVPKGIGVSPKKIGIAIAAAQIFPFFEKIFKPLAYLMLIVNKASNFIIDLIVRFRIPQKTNIPAHAEKPLKFLKNKWLKGILSDHEYHYLSGLIKIKDTKLRDIIKNKKRSGKVFSLNLNMSVEDAFYQVQDTFLSRIPLVKNGKPQGILLRRDILKFAADPLWSKRSLGELYSFMVSNLNGQRELFTCIDTMNAETLFNRFLSSGGIQMAVLTNARGKITNVITLEDMLEYVFNWEILDESDHYQFRSFKPSLLKNVNIDIRKRFKVLKNSLAQTSRNQALTRDVRQKSTNIKRQLTELDQPEKYLLFDTLWSVTHEGLSRDPYIYSRNKFAFHELSIWFSKHKRYKDTFNVLTDILHAIRDDYGNTINYHDTYVTFYKILRVLQNPNDINSREQKLPVKIDSALLKSFKKNVDKFKGINFFIHVKEMAKTIENAKTGHSKSFFIKIKKVLSVLSSLTFLSALPVAAFFISPVAGAFMTATVITATLSGLVSSSEAAIFSVNKSIIEKQAAKGDKRAHNLMKILNNTEKYIPTMVFVNNLVNIPGAIYLAEFAIPLFGKIASTIVSTFVIMFFGEGVPKDQGLKHSEIIAKTAASPLIFFNKVFSPLVSVMKFLTNAIKAYVEAISYGRISFADEEKTTRSLKDYQSQRKELKDIDDILSNEKVINTPLKELIRKGFDFFDRSNKATRLSEIITNKSNSEHILEIPSTDPVTGEKMTIAKAHEILFSAPHSRIMIYDLYKDGTKKYFGYIFKDDLIQSFKENKFHHSITELAYPNFSIREENFPAYSLLKEFFSGKSHLSLVRKKDNTLVAISLEDIIEYLLDSEIEDEIDIDARDLVKILYFDSDGISFRNFTGKSAA